MSTLFPLAPVYPPGFFYYSDFISPAEEASLLKDISEIELHSFIFQGFEAKRRVASFGYDYSFDKRSLSKGKEIPKSFEWLISKISQHIGTHPEVFSELLITEYPVGSVINWHRDAPPFDIIAGVSLSADCIFRLKPHEKTKQTRASTVSIAVKRRSLYIIRDEARTAWQHSTLPVKSVRHSITLRSLRNQSAG